MSTSPTAAASAAQHAGDERRSASSSSSPAVSISTTRRDKVEDEDEGEGAGSSRTADLGGGVRGEVEGL